jgi:hypothetical protein
MKAQLANVEPPFVRRRVVVLLLLEQFTHACTHMCPVAQWFDPRQ